MTHRTSFVSPLLDLFAGCDQADGIRNSLERQEVVKHGTARQNCNATKPSLQSNKKIHRTYPPSIYLKFSVFFSIKKKTHSSYSDDHFYMIEPFKMFLRSEDMAKNVPSIKSIVHNSNPIDPS